MWTNQAHWQNQNSEYKLNNIFGASLCFVMQSFTFIISPITGLARIWICLPANVLTGKISNFSGQLICLFSQLNYAGRPMHLWVRIAMTEFVCILPEIIIEMQRNPWMVICWFKKGVEIWGLWRVFSKVSNDYVSANLAAFFIFLLSMSKF